MTVTTAQRRLLLLAGGQSEEHEVSLISARAVLREAQSAGFDCAIRVITRSGGVLGPQQSEQALRDGKAPQGGGDWGEIAAAAEQADVIFPLIHGTLGEDGTLQGYLTLLDRPFVGSATLASAVCMDKPMAKEVLRAHGIPQTDYLTLTWASWGQRQASLLGQIEEHLSQPWFIKPANLGSSVGISRATSSQELKESIDKAFRFDRRVIVEAGVERAREIEVGILGNSEPEASVVGEITYEALFYDYEAKYHDTRSKMHIPAELPGEIASRVQSLAQEAYTLLDCAGFARIDFFYQPHTQQVLLNEINTLPGFTPQSMFPSLWQAKGLAYQDLIRRLVDLAQKRHSEVRRAREAKP